MHRLYFRTEQMIEEKVEKHGGRRNACGVRCVFVFFFSKARGHRAEDPKSQKPS